jgi:hypothetical protein
LWLDFHSYKKLTVKITKLKLQVLLTRFQNWTFFDALHECSIFNFV